MGSRRAEAKGFIRPLRRFPFVALLCRSLSSSILRLSSPSEKIKKKESEKGCQKTLPTKFSDKGGGIEVPEGHPPHVRLLEPFSLGTFTFLPVSSPPSCNRCAGQSLM